MKITDSNPPGRLVSHFVNRDRTSQSTGWSELWDSNESELWDRGEPSPALVDWIASGSDLVPQPSNGRRPRALVPGCGKGYDVVMLALHGFDVIGLEVSPRAVDTAQDYAEAELRQPSKANFAPTESRADHQPGNINFVCGDFFQRDWEASCFIPAGEDEGFDLIYDYTFLCALLPTMREDWARRMRELLRPTGILVCLEFPLYKDVMAVGPPWGLQGVYWNLLSEGGDGIVNTSTGSVKAADSKRGRFERVAYINPPRSYEIGRGTDMLSAWKLRAGEYGT